MSTTEEVLAAARDQVQDLGDAAVFSHDVRTVIRWGSIRPTAAALRGWPGTAVTTIWLRSCVSLIPYAHLYWL
jgi:hypothetical protein